MSVSVCFSVCLSASIIAGTTFQILMIFLVSVTYGRGSVPLAALRCYVLPVVWMTSYLQLHTMGHTEHIDR